MNSDAREAVKMTQVISRDHSKQPQLEIQLNEILLLEDRKSLGAEVEQWALEYTSKFIHAAGPGFYPTTIAQILGTAYVKKGLPEVRSHYIVAVGTL